MLLSIFLPVLTLICTTFLAIYLLMLFSDQISDAFKVAFSKSQYITSNWLNIVKYTIYFMNVYDYDCSV